MTFIPRLCLLGACIVISCKAFLPQYKRGAWNTPKVSHGASRLHVSSSSQHVTNSTGTTSFAYYNDNEQPHTSKTLFEKKGIQQLEQLQALEKQLQSPTMVDDMIPTTLVEQESSVVTTTSNEGSTVWNARLLLLGAAALYGTNFSVIKIMGDTMPVGISASLRFGLAALATLPWLLQPPKDGSNLMESITSSSSMDSPRNAWQSLQQLSSTTTVGAAIAGFEVGLLNSVGYLAQAVGLATTDASKSAFICSLAVVIVPIMDFISGKRLLPREISGAIMAVAGVGVLEFGGASDLSLSSGDIASLLQPIMFGVAFWRMETAMRKYPDEANRSTAAQLLAVFSTSMIYCLSTCTIDYQQIIGWLMDPMIMGALFFTGIITTALTIYMEAVALKTLTAAETTLILSTEPLWGAGFAALLIGEEFGVDAAIGATLIIAGCIFSNLGVDGVMEMITGKTADSALLEGSDDTMQEGLNVESAERAILEVGLIGAMAQLVAWLEADILIGGASIVAAEEIVEEVSKDLLS